jgi:nucleotide-binding universal stress UspA family protein
MPPEHVLVPLDGSPLADDALVEALETYDCPVTVLNVVTPLDAGMSEGGVLEPGAERQADARERANDLIERAERRAAAEGREIDTLVETGDPADTILEAVAELDVDHVVMGGHGGERNELARRLLGTVATSVVSEAPVSVTVVR